MDCSMSGFPVHHQLPELTQTHAHLVGDTVQPSHPLSSPSPPTFNLFQHQGLFQWVSSLHQVAKVSEFQLQHQSLGFVPTKKSLTCIQNPYIYSMHTPHTHTHAHAHHFYLPELPRLLCPLAILPEGSLCARPGSGLRWSYCPSQGSPGATGWGATCGFF